MIRAAVGGDAQAALSGAALVQSLGAESGAPPTRTPQHWHCSLLPAAVSCWGSSFAREMFCSVATAAPVERNAVLRGYALAQLALVEAPPGTSPRRSRPLPRPWR